MVAQTFCVSLVLAFFAFILGGDRLIGDAFFPEDKLPPLPVHVGWQDGSLSCVSGDSGCQDAYGGLQRHSLWLPALYASDCAAHAAGQPGAGYVAADWPGPLDVHPCRGN